MCWRSRTTEIQLSLWKVLPSSACFKRCGRGLSFNRVSLMHLAGIPLGQRKTAIMNLNLRVHGLAPSVWVHPLFLRPQKVSSQLLTPAPRTTLNPLDLWLSKSATRSDSMGSLTWSCANPQEEPSMTRVRPVSVETLSHWQWQHLHPPCHWTQWVSIPLPILALIAVQGRPVRSGTCKWHQPYSCVAMRWLWSKRM